MDKFVHHTGIAAPLIRNNIDTDTIIPSREMKSVSKTGLADGLFAPWRYHNALERELNKEFILNQAMYADCSILLSGNNFGCGSSREHAVWALKEFGFRCLIAQGYGSIFFRNCVRNGILPIVMSADQIAELAAYVEQDPNQHTLRIDLENLTIAAGTTSFTFACDTADRDMLLQGLDPIDMTLQMRQQIDAFTFKDKKARPWLYAEQG